MAGNFLKYGASDSSFGAKTANDIAVDAHELIALCAPRLTFSTNRTGPRCAHHDGGNHKAVRIIDLGFDQWLSGCRLPAARDSKDSEPN
jgi:hypothetical protein